MILDLPGAVTSLCQQGETSVLPFGFLLLTWAIRRGDDEGLRRKVPGVQPRDASIRHLPPAVRPMLGGKELSQVVLDSSVDGLAL